MRARLLPKNRARRARADVDPDHPIRALDRGDLEVIDAHDPLAIHVDDLAVEDIATEEDLIRSAVEGGDIQLARGKDGARGGQAGDLVGRDEKLATSLAGDQAGDGGIDLTDAHDEIAHRRDPPSAVVANGGADQLRQVEHSSEIPPCPSYCSCGHAADE